MRKVASPRELQVELKRLIGLTQLQGVSRSVMARELNSLSSRLAAEPYAELMHKLKTPNWELWYDKHSEDLVGEYKPPGGRKSGESSVSVGFFGSGALDEIERSDKSKLPVHFNIEYTEGADYKGQIGPRSKSGEIRSLADMKKVFKDAEKLWEKAEAQRESRMRR